MKKEIQMAIIFRSLPEHLKDVRLLVIKYLNSKNFEVSSDDEELLNRLDFFHELCKR